MLEYSKRVWTTDLPSWCSQRQSGQKTKLHLEELHSARDADTRDGDVHNGQCVSRSPAIDASTGGHYSLALNRKRNRRCAID